MQKSKIIRRAFYLLCLFIVIYALCFQWELLVSLGLGDDNIGDCIEGLIPAVLLTVIPLGLYWDSIRLSYIVPNVLIGLSWAVTGPLLNYTTLVKSNTIYLNNIYDIYVGLYLFSILFIANMLLKQFASKRWGPLAMTGLQLIALIVPAMQWIYYVLYDSCITTSGALIIYQTNPAEALEYVHSLGTPTLLLILITSAIVLFGLFKGNALSTKFPKTQWHKMIVPITAALLIVPSVFALYDEIFPECFPIRLFLDTKDYMDRSALYETYHADKYAALQAIQVNKPDYPHTVILVIGESETRTLMNAYNPEHVENTPWLTAERSNPRFTLFNNAYSCVWYTVPVLEHALTESNFYNNAEFNQSISIIDMARKVGYKTYWFSNQGSVGVADTPITLVANTADVSQWTDRDLKESCHDDALLGFLNQVDPNENNFIVLHIMGSHIEYRNRYPQEFQRFNDGKYNEEADFDNTVLYTDWILSQIYEYGRDNLNLDAMMYFSDHGSDPLEGRKPDETGFKVLRIPMFCYLSPAYMSRNPDIAQTIRAHQDDFFTNDLIYEFVCGVLNIQSPNYDQSYSIASPEWKMKRADLVTRFGQTSLLDDKEF